MVAEDSVVQDAAAVASTNEPAGTSGFVASGPVTPAQTLMDELDSQWHASVPLPRAVKAALRLRRSLG